MDDQQLHADLATAISGIERNRYWVLTLEIEGQLACTHQHVKQLITLLEDLGIPKPASDPNTQSLDVEMLQEFATDLQHLINIGSFNRSPPIREVR